MRVAKGNKMDIISRFFTPILLFILTLAFGFWLSKVGKPYNGALFNIHKLIALGAVVFAVIQISKTGVPDSPLLVVALVVVGLCVLVLFASGALMSIGKLDYTLTLTIHRVSLAVLVIAAGTATYLLNFAY
jgi:hypothetical protein